MVDVLSREECLTLLATVPIGRVGVTINALPAVLPVNFAVLDGDIVFRTVDGTKFHAAAAGNVVAFEVDSYHPEGMSGWSVVVPGVSLVVTDPSELDRVRRLMSTRGPSMAAPIGRCASPAASSADEGSSEPGRARLTTGSSRWPSQPIDRRLGKG